MRIPVAKEGVIGAKVFGGLAIVFYITGYYLRPLYFISSISFLFMLFLLFFFRDPEREITPGDNLILSPADGKVLDIRKEKTEFLDSPSNVIKIFMSPLNIHIQRAPIDGTVNMVKYKQGAFITAYKEEASIINEQNIIVMETAKSKSFKILIKQISGILARRIVCWCKEKDDIRKGDRIGLIGFGSQVDLYLPESIKIMVKKKDKVKAGITVIGEIST